MLIPNKAPVDVQEKRRNAIEIVRLLLRAGADPNRPTRSRTPLSLAACAGDSEVAGILLDAGADPSGQSWSPFSKLPRVKGQLSFYDNAIHQVAEKGSVKIVRLLIDKRADINATNHEGETALDIALARGCRHHLIIAQSWYLIPAKPC